jgi:hypothetical protein
LKQLPEGGRLARRAVLIRHAPLLALARQAADRIKLRFGLAQAGRNGE